MQSLHRNRTTLYYATYLRQEPVLDDEGNETGEHYAIYSDPVALKANVSGADGAWGVRVFGEWNNYDRTVVMTGSCPLKEADHIWLDKDTDSHWNYIVTRVCKGIDENVVAISEVPSSV